MRRKAVLISAKSGIGIPDVLEAIVHQLPAPKIGDANAPLKAMLVDSWYDPYLGVIVLVRVIDGVHEKGHDHPHDGGGGEISGGPHRRFHAENSQRG